MRQELLIVFLFCLLSGLARGQNFGNNWIQYDQPHWAFQIAEEGFYEISFETLEANGIVLNSTASLQLFGHQEEVRYQVMASAPGVFGPGDKIRFWATKNDGEQENALYLEADQQLNRNYSLFNDTIQYYLTTGSVPAILPYATTPENGTTTHNFCLATSRVDYAETYQVGQRQNNGVSLPHYESGEGWTSQSIGIGTNRITQLPTPGAIQSLDVPNATISTNIVGASTGAGIEDNHRARVTYTASGFIGADEVFDDYDQRIVSFDVENEFLFNSISIRHLNIGVPGLSQDNIATSYAEITYARDFDLAGDSTMAFAIPNGPLNFARVAFENYGGTAPPMVFVKNKHLLREIQTISEGEGEDQIWLANIPLLGDENIECILTNVQSALPIQTLAPVSNTGFFTEYGTQNGVNAFVLVSQTRLMDAAMNYANYRESQGQQVILADIEELYAQYAGGVRKSPLAIRNFARHLISANSPDPQHLFLVGKSIREMKVNNTIGARDNPEYYARNLIPSMGNPTSDAALTAQIGGSTYAPKIATGRLAAETPEQVMDYLSKVMEHESQSPALWQKNILHFGGGGNVQEQNIFRAYLEEYENTAQDTCLGGKVYTFLKTTSNPIQISLSDSIAQLINEGTSLMTFFGHASSTGFDQNIDEPEAYDNQGKYPLIIGNSCFTGNIHLAQSTSTSERFVLAPNGGSIGFLAKTDFGLPAPLHNFTKRFYTEIFQENYGTTIGQAMRTAIEQINASSIAFYDRNAGLTFALHGDPALKLHPKGLPDYAILEDKIIIEPEIITTAVDSFLLQIPIANLGKATRDSISMEVVQHLPSGLTRNYIKTLPPVLHLDTASFKIPVDALLSLGTSEFDIFLDYPVSEVEELEEVSNNVLQGKPIDIFAAGIIPVWPFEYAVVPDENITLKASTGLPILDEKIYTLQIDTEPTYDSPNFLETTSGALGGVVSWELPFSLQPEETYYWRSGVQFGDSIVWEEKSFSHLPDRAGWGQNDYWQFAQNKLNGKTTDDQEENINFLDGVVELKCTTYGHPENGFELFDTKWQLDLEIQDYSGCGSIPSIHVAVIDPNTLLPWESNFNGANPQFDFGNHMVCANARGRPEKYFIFRQNFAPQLEALRNMLENEIPDGHHVLIYSWRHADYASWASAGVDLAPTFANLGATQIGTAQDSVPFIFYTRMGQPETAIEIYGQDQGDNLELGISLEGSLSAGKIATAPTQPLSNVQSFEWNWDIETSDSVAMAIRGTQTGVVLLETEQPTGVLNAPGDWFTGQNTQFDLSVLSQDPSQQSAPQPDYWRLLGLPAPELALDAQDNFILPPDTLQEGSFSTLSIPFRNISDYAMDSVLVKYSILLPNQELASEIYRKLAPIAPQEIMQDTLIFDTAGLFGNCQVRYEVNAKAAGDNDYDQLEQYHFNNIAQTSFFVSRDQENPILEVTFDGINILDGEIVSAKPQIAIRLDDENPFFILDQPGDTAFFKMFLSTPTAVDEQLYFSAPEIQWTPADSENRVNIYFEPEFLQDGKYALRVQASDKSGNASGDIDYKINFEVVNESTVTAVMNYPNPFSTRTQFVFNLTGSEVPDDIRIQIMTISGKVVREIERAELGVLRIGRNRTDFWWNGTDTYGDQLANGVYLYRVIIRHKGQTVQQKSTAGDQYFKEEFGKMYLLR